MKKITRITSKIQAAVKRSLLPNRGYGTLADPSEIEDKRFGY